MAALSQKRLSVMGPAGTMHARVARRYVAVKCQQTRGSSQAVNRRATLIGTLFGALAHGLPGQAQAAVATRLRPLADLPMERLRLPKGGVGRDYVLVKVNLGFRKFEPGS